MPRRGERESEAVVSRARTEQQHAVVGGGIMKDRRTAVVSVDKRPRLRQRSDGAV